MVERSQMLKALAELRQLRDAPGKNIAHAIGRRLLRERVAGFVKGTNDFTLARRSAPDLTRQRAAQLA